MMVRFTPPHITNGEIDANNYQVHLYNDHASNPPTLDPFTHASASLANWFTNRYTSFTPPAAL